ncbi:MAG: hypothetical protein OQK81_00735 [Candidatus Bathyarchaeota archaeon]|nr:hypothetical protein [Candidatus Bathyarchaeota archaeon]
MLDSFKEVLEKEREAETIVNNARKIAQKIETETEEKAELVYKQTYQETIEQAKQEAILLKEHAKKDAESNAQSYVINAEKTKKKLVAMAEQNYDEAVNMVLEEILS